MISTITAQLAQEVTPDTLAQMKENIKSAQTVLRSVAKQNSEGKAFADMSEFEGITDYQLTLYNLQEAYSKAEQETKKMEEKMQADIQSGLKAHNTAPEPEPVKKQYAKPRQLMTVATMAQAMTAQDSFRTYLEQAKTQGSTASLSCVFSVPMQYFKEARASMYSTQALTYDVPLEPREAIGSTPAPVLRFLDFVPIMSSPGSHIYYHQIKARATGGGARARGAEIADANLEFDRKAEEKKSLAALLPIDIEMQIASPDMYNTSAMQLIYRLDQLMNAAALSGDGTGENWRGLTTHLTGSGVSTEVPASNGLSMQEYLQDSVRSLGDDGYTANAIFLSRRDSNKVDKKLRAMSYMDPDLFYSNGTAPMVDRVQLRPTVDIAANHAVVGEFNAARFHIETQDDIMFAISSDVNFKFNQDVMRATVLGNTACLNLMAFHEYTKTNQTVES